MGGSVSNPEVAAMGRFSVRKRGEKPYEIYVATVPMHPLHFGKDTKAFEQFLEARLSEAGLNYNRRNGRPTKEQQEEYVSYFGNLSEPGAPLPVAILACRVENDEAVSKWMVIGFFTFTMFTIKSAKFNPDDPGVVGFWTRSFDGCTSNPLGHIPGTIAVDAVRLALAQYVATVEAPDPRIGTSFTTTFELSNPSTVGILKNIFDSLRVGEDDLDLHAKLENSKYDAPPGSVNESLRNSSPPVKDIPFVRGTFRADSARMAQLVRDDVYMLPMDTGFRSRIAELHTELGFEKIGTFLTFNLSRRETAGRQPTIDALRLFAQQCTMFQRNPYAKDVGDEITVIRRPRFTHTAL